MKTFFATVLFAFGSAVALAANPIDPERLAEARALLDAMHVERQIDSVSGVMAESMAKQFAQGNSGVDPRRMQIGLEESMKVTKEQSRGPGGLLDTLAEAYAGEFTFGELRQIREFYQSPAGQRMLLASPELMRQVFPRMMEAARAAAPVVCARTKARLMAEKIAGGADMKCPVAP